jgi:hypothetical protein
VNTGLTIALPQTVMMITGSLRIRWEERGIREPSPTDLNKESTKCPDRRPTWWREMG